jgi:two-component system, NarL family, vancomycin resistance associated response regulator VraR
VSKQILIADDSGTIRRILKMFLQTRKNLMVCGEAANGCEAIEKAKALRPDLILLDLAMPEMNGAEAASVLKKMMPDVPIILFTMYSENIGASLTSAIGVDMVLSKPNGMLALVEAVDTLLSSRQSRGTTLPADS